MTLRTSHPNRILPAAAIIAIVALLLVPSTSPALGRGKPKTRSCHGLAAKRLVARRRHLGAGCKKVLISPGSAKAPSSPAPASASTSAPVDFAPPVAPAAESARETPGDPAPPPTPVPTHTPEVGPVALPDPPVEAPVEKPATEAPPLEKPPVEKLPVEPPSLETPALEAPPVEIAPIETPASGAPAEKTPATPAEEALTKAPSTPTEGSKAPAEPPVETPPPVEHPASEVPVVTEPATPIEPDPVEPDPVEAPFRFFSPTSIWNEPIPADAGIDPASAAIMQSFNEQVLAATRKKGAPGCVNTSRWSVPVYTAGAEDPKVKVTLTRKVPALQAAFEEVPLPPDALPAAGTDGHLVLWQPSTDSLWEFWQLRRDGHGGWLASWGGAMQQVSENPGYYGPGAWPGAMTNWGASGSSLSIAGGLITLEDLEMGQINHALAISLPNIRAKVYSDPAERTDGGSTSPTAVPMGAHLRLDPNLDLTRLNLPPMTLLMAEAAQKYGIIVRDSAANIAFYGQDPTPTGTEPYNGGYYGRLGCGQIVAAFPWEHLEVLQMTLHSAR